MKMTRMLHLKILTTLAVAGSWLADIRLATAEQPHSMYVEKIIKKWGYPADALPTRPASFTIDLVITVTRTIVKA